MTDIPETAEQRSWELFKNERAGRPHAATETVWQYAFARHISEVSKTVKVVDAFISAAFATTPVSEVLSSLILPDPESNLLKEAREICAQREEENGYTFDAAKFRMGNEDNSFAMRCTLAALKHRKDG